MNNHPKFRIEKGAHSLIKEALLEQFCSNLTDKQVQELNNKAIEYQQYVDSARQSRFELASIVRGVIHAKY